MRNLHAGIRALRGPILVTGASGFVGANLFNMIAAVRLDVYAVVLREKGWRLADVRDEQVVACDLNDAAATKNLIDSVAPQTVFDCVAYGAYSFERDSTLIHETNYQSLVNLVNLLQGRTFGALVHAGSSSEYGRNCTAPREDAPCEPNSHYAVSKLAGTNFLRYMGRSVGFPCATLRLYSVYGPWEDPGRLMPALLRAALAGTWPPLANPAIARDFVYVDDVADAFIRAASLPHGDPGAIYNVGSGRQTTLGDLVELARGLFGVAAEPEWGVMPARGWDTTVWVSDPRKIAAALGWRAATPLEDGLRAMAAWLAAHYGS